MNPNPKSKNVCIFKSVFADVVSPIFGEKSQSTGKSYKMVGRSSLADKYQFFRHWWCKCRKSLTPILVRLADIYTARESFVRGSSGEIKAGNAELTNLLGYFGFIRRQSQPCEWIIWSRPRHQTARRIFTTAHGTTP